MRVRLVHTTRLDYSADVVEGVMDVRLGPHTDADQRWDAFALAVHPAASVRGYTDGFGNRAHLITLARPHGAIEVVARGEVTTLLDDPAAPPPRAPEPLGQPELVDYLYPSRLAPALPVVAEVAAAFRPASPADAFDAARRLAHLVRERLDYRPGATTVSTTVADVLSLGAGVCQDFSHLLIALCRAAGIPARYVSGYLVAGAGGPDAPRGDPQASHAWVEAFTPTHGWRGLDPTNGVLAGPAHVKVAIGRDYGDVPPTRGAFRGAAEERLTVRVESGPA
jgi:transglutaminase-like putative cysteine protease